MDVYSYDGKTERHIAFRKGEPVTGVLEERELDKKERRTGTVIHWKPDREVFTNVDITPEMIKKTLHRQAVVVAGVTFVFRYTDGDGKLAEERFFYQNGISDYIREIVGESAGTEPVLWHLEARGRDRDDLKDYNVQADISFCVSNAVNCLEYYHCGSFLEYGGSPDRAVKSAFAFALDKYIKNAGKYNKNESKITFADIADCLVLISSSISTSTSYENQTKKAINNTFIYEAMNDFLRKNLEIYFTEHPIEAETFANQVLVNKRSRESAEKERLNIKKKLTGTLDIANRVEKFVNCRSKNPEIRELYIVEGDSALSSCKLGRNAEYQAIIPVRGKTLNCLKAPYDRIFKSDIITDLLKVIGCGVELHGKVKTDMPAFDISALRWSKIIICTDADEDGFQIRTLLLTLFYRLLPTLLQNGKVFIAESPLFEITVKEKGQDKIYFAYNEFEKAEILKKLEGKKYTLQRSKGLGENEPDMMWQTTMNPETRRLIAITPTDAERTYEIFDTLLGDNLPARKAFIAEHGQEYIKDADI